jgi:hypothetical protein
MRRLTVCDRSSSQPDPRKGRGPEARTPDGPAHCFRLHDRSRILRQPGSRGGNRSNVGRASRLNGGWSASRYHLHGRFGIPFPGRFQDGNCRNGACASRLNVGWGVFQCCPGDRRGIVPLGVTLHDMSCSVGCAIRQSAGWDAPPGCPHGMLHNRCLQRHCCGTACSGDVPSWHCESGVALQRGMSCRNPLRGRSGSAAGPSWPGCRVS